VSIDFAAMQIVSHMRASMQQELAMMWYKKVLCTRQVAG
jgi:hypothetical protein